MQLSVTGNLIRLRNAQYWTSGAWSPLSGTVGATLTASILNTDTAQTPVANAQSVPMTLDAGTQSDWSCIMPSSVTLIDGSVYYVLINVAISGVTVPIKQKFLCGYPTGNAVGA